MMSNRDEFPEKTKRALALRANHHCSFRECPQPTSGPSDESPDAVSMIGKAAHIHAAASGGPRYCESMSKDERCSIENAIWLCATHADLIDRDEITYTADRLREMKAEHEKRCAEKLSIPPSAGEAVFNLIAIGPEIVFRGEFLGINNGVWSFHLHNFVDGDVYNLTLFVNCFEKNLISDRYILVNDLGDGRVLRDRPCFSKETTGGYTIRCPVFPSADRIPAVQLPRRWARSEDHDLKGKWAMVSGLDALPDQVKNCLSLQRGESPIHREFGTRFAEYYNLLCDSPWRDCFLKLELIRQAAIPYLDPTNGQQYTPLQCVERVLDIKTLANAPANNWLPVRVKLNVKGVGIWERDISVCIPLEPTRRTPFDMFP